ncbi:11429_t:CDS:2, partial [Diversispora eburnea]
DWEYNSIGKKVALKEIKDSIYDIVEFLKVDDLHKFLTKNFWDLRWRSKIDILLSIALGLETLHTKNLVHCDLHSGNILINDSFDLINYDLVIDLENTADNDVIRQLKIADENQKNTSKSQKQELFELFSYSSKLHPQSCYISRYIFTLYGLNDLLEDLKSGKSSDPNLLFKSNESTTSSVNTHDIAGEIEIQSK